MSVGMKTAAGLSGPAAGNAKIVTFERPTNTPPKGERASRETTPPAAIDRFEWARMLRRDPSLLPRDKVVAQYLAERASDDGKAWPSRATIAEGCGMKLRTIDTALAELKRRGWLSGVKTRFRGTTEVTLSVPVSQCRSVQQHCASNVAAHGEIETALCRSRVQSNVAAHGEPMLQPTANNQYKDQYTDQNKNKNSLNHGSVPGDGSALPPDWRPDEIVGISQESFVFAFRQVLGLQGASSEAVKVRFEEIPLRLRERIESAWIAGRLSKGWLSEAVNTRRGT